MIVIIFNLIFDFVGLFFVFFYNGSVTASYRRVGRLVLLAFFIWIKIFFEGLNWSLAGQVDILIIKFCCIKWFFFALELSDSYILHIPVGYSDENYLRFFFEQTKTFAKLRVFEHSLLTQWALANHLYCRIFYLIGHG